MGTTPLKCETTTAPPPSPEHHIGLMSRTNTHYQFDSPAPAGLDVGPSAGAPAGGVEEQDFGLGLGVEAVDPAILRSLITSPRRASLERSPPVERRSSYQPTSFESPGRKSTAVSPPRKEPERLVSRSVATPSVLTPTSTDCCQFHNSELHDHYRHYHGHQNHSPRVNSHDGSHSYQNRTKGLV